MDSLLKKAAAQGRNFLTEHEAYDFIASLGLEVPAHELIKDRPALDSRIEAITAEYTDRIVLKIASPDIHHKTEIGGVAIVKNEPEAIREAFDAMLARAAKAQPDATLDGVLLMEMVEIERELIISLIDDPTFGHILSIGKGGTLTEIFKDIAIRPAPVDKAHIEPMLRSLKTWPLIEGYRGAKGVDVNSIVEFAAKISSLARNDSAAAPSEYEIAELEINPLVVTKDGRVMPIDSILRFQKAKPLTAAARPDLTHIDKLFRPGTIAVVGASDTPLKMGGAILKLLSEKSSAKIFPINPKKNELLGLKAYKSIADVPEPIDLAVLAVPAKFTPGVVEQCAAAGVKTAIIISAGFGEMGKEGREIEDQMRATAQTAGMRLIGPNCMGVYYEPTSLSTFFLDPDKTEIPHRDVNNFTVLSQSGAVCVQMVELTGNVGTRAIVSYGNMIDIDVADLAAYFDKDEGTDAIGIYIEGLKNGPRFLAAANEMTKPTIIIKGGKSHAGGAATVGHTGAIAGDYDVARAVFQSAGLIEATTLQEFADFCKTFSFLTGRPAAARRIAVVTNAGGLGVLSADTAEKIGLEMSRFEKKTVKAIEELTGGLVLANNPTDLTAGISANDFIKAAQHILEDTNVDGLVLIPGIQPHQMKRQVIIDELIALYNRCKKPMVVTITPTEKRIPLFNKLEAARLPHYDTPERAVRALGAYLKHFSAKRK